MASFNGDQCRTASVPPAMEPKYDTRLSAYLDYAVRSVLRVEAARPIQPTDYDTCWVARLTNPDGTLAYPDLHWQLLERQRPDGSWGGTIPYAHDRLLTTLAIVLLLARFGRRHRDKAQRLAGERYIWQQARTLRYETHRTVGFEMILPTLLAEARELGVDLPYAQLRHYRRERTKKLSILPTERLFEVRTSALFSLEAFAGELNLEDAAGLLLKDGSMATSPSATAFLLCQVPDWRSRYPKSVDYLEELLARYDMVGLPPIAPCDIFVRAWSMYYLYHGNLLAGHAELVESNCEYLLRHWRPEGIGWASTGLPESDDTAMVLLALRRTGYDVDGSCLFAYERDRHFAVLEHERDPSVSANLHILEALDTIPSRARGRVRDKILGFVLRARHHGAFWTDKWHISPYYPTSRALMVLPSYVPEDMDASAHWLLATQRASGAWGHHAPTAEETALTLLALLKYHREVRSLPHEPLHRAARYLIVDEAPFQEHYPELWFSKALYAPTVVVRSTILAALGLYRDTFDEGGSGWS
jgi:halimadienyl-diphosphate synthase